MYVFWLLVKVNLLNIIYVYYLCKNKLYEVLKFVEYM